MDFYGGGVGRALSTLEAFFNTLLAEELSSGGANEC